MAGVKRKGVMQDVKRKVKGSGTPKPHSTSLTKTPGNAAQNSDEDTSEDLVESDTTETEVFEGFGDSDDQSVGNRIIEGRAPTKGSIARASSRVDKIPDNKASTSSGATAGTSSREAHAKQKALTQERKAAKPNAPHIQRSKKLWERLRRKSDVPLAERKELVVELFSILTGHVKDFVFKHDAARVVQTAVKYGNMAQRKAVARELKGEYRSMAESRYAKFLVGKLLARGDAELRDMILPEFYSHVRRLIKHPEASWILDDIYRGIATQQQKDHFLCEWYGPEYALFQKTDDEKSTSKLSQILLDRPEKRTPIMRSLLELINHLVQKKMTGFTMLHDAMLQYLSNVRPGSEEMSEFIQLIQDDEEGDLLKNLAFTKSGSQVASLILAYGTAQDRRRTMKAYRDIIYTMSYDTNAHLVLLVCYEVIDDTVLTSKTIFPGILNKEKTTQEEPILNIAEDLNARIPLLYLPAGRTQRLLSADHIKFLEWIDQIRSSTSKKNPILRRQELLSALSPLLLEAVQRHVIPLCRSSFGRQIISETLLGCLGDKSMALRAVAEAAKGDPSDIDHLARNKQVARMLKNLILGGYFNAKLGRIEAIGPPLGFHDMFYDEIRPRLVAWATGPSSFVIVDLLEAPGFSRREEAVKLLWNHVETLTAAAKPTTNEQKEPARQRQEQQSENVDNGGRKRRKISEGVGNRGAMILLEKIGRST